MCHTVECTFLKKNSTTVSVIVRFTHFHIRPPSSVIGTPAFYLFNVFFRFSLKMSLGYQTLLSHRRLHLQNQIWKSDVFCSL